MDTIEKKHLIIVFIPTVLAFLFHMYKHVEEIYAEISTTMPLMLISEHYQL